VTVLGRQAAVTLFSAWFAVTVAVFLLRPGEVLELAVAGASGAVAIAALQTRSVALPVAVTAAACFVTPLLYAWPIRTYESHQVPGPLGAFASVSSLVPLAALLASAGRSRPVFARPPLLLMLGGAALACAGIASSIAAIHAGSAFGNAWLVYGAPMCLGLAILSSARGGRDVQLYLAALVLGALPQLVVAIAAYVVDFGVPTSAGDLVSAKASLFRPHLIQDQALGNVGHLADFCLALLIPALIVACGRQMRTSTRIGAAASGVATVVVLVLVLSRSAIAVAVVVLLGALAVMASRRRPVSGIAAVTASALFLVAISAAPAVRRSYERLLPASASAPAKSRGGGTNGSAGGASATFRLGAQETAWDIARKHMPWGVGTGQYRLYDPVHTAPHSLPLQAIGELGILGAAGWILLAAYAAWRSLQLVIRRTAWWLEELAAAGSVVAVLLQGVIAGLTLQLGHANISALILWIGLGCLAALERVGQAA
jgi:hypothetical protein